MAGIPGKGGVKGRSGPHGNMNAFKHGLAAIQKRREESVTTEHEENVRQQILEGLIADKGGGSAGIHGHQDFSGGYSQRRRLADGLQWCHRSHHPEQSEGSSQRSSPQIMHDDLTRSITLWARAL